MCRLECTRLRSGRNTSFQLAEFIIIGWMTRGMHVISLLLQAYSQSDLNSLKSMFRMRLNFKRYTLKVPTDYLAGHGCQYSERNNCTYSRTLTSNPPSTPFSQNSTVISAIVFGFRTLFSGLTSPSTVISPIWTPLSLKARLKLCTMLR
jgi:hypothetical protein